MYSWILSRASSVAERLIWAEEKNGMAISENKSKRITIILEVDRKLIAAKK